MLKYFYILLLVLIFNWASGAIQVGMKIPATAEAGVAFNVQVSFSNVDVNGFARLMQEIPAGFTATPINIEGATFYFENNTVKLIWEKLPEKPKFTITYELKSSLKSNGEFALGKGQFDFQKESSSDKVEVKSKKINITKSTKPIVELPKEIKKDPLPTETKIEATTLKTPSKTTINSSNILFRVQFQASSAKQNINDLKQKYSIKENIYEEQVDGMFKYTYGDFKNIDEAKKSSSDFKTRTSVLNFVLAYENGKRISVKDALDKINAAK
ncbi:MAG: hypothetical protein WCK02_04520 [Bacteroidota bacterium]